MKNSRFGRVLLGTSFYIIVFFVWVFWTTRNMDGVAAAYYGLGLWGFLFYAIILLFFDQLFSKKSKFEDKRKLILIECILALFMVVPLSIFSARGIMWFYCLGGKC